MKTILITLILACMSLNLLFAQNVYYNSEGKKKQYYKEDTDLLFTRSANVRIPRSEGQEAGALLSLLPTAVDLGFKIANNMLENRKKRFTGEYAMQKSYIDAGVVDTKMENRRIVPDLTFIRTITTEKDSQVDQALKIVFRAEKMEGIDGFFYYIESIALKYAKARNVKKDQTFDYTIEIKPTFLAEGKKQTQEIMSITVTGVEYNMGAAFEKNKYRTEFIPLPKNSTFIEAAVKVIEINPVKVRTEKILEIFNTYKDDAKTVINNFLPSDKKTEEKGDSIAKETDKTDKKKNNPNTPVGN